jgi:hypothetical protein
VVDEPKQGNAAWDRPGHVFCDAFASPGVSKAGSLARPVIALEPLALVVYTAVGVISLGANGRNIGVL